LAIADDLLACHIFKKKNSMLKNAGKMKEISRLLSGISLLRIITEVVPMIYEY
jgi:hypothetical protein